MKPRDLDMHLQSVIGFHQHLVSGGVQQQAVEFGILRLVDIALFGGEDGHGHFEHQRSEPLQLIRGDPLDNGFGSQAFERPADITNLRDFLGGYGGDIAARAGPNFDEAFFSEAVDDATQSDEAGHSAEASSHARQAQRLLGFLRDDVPGFIAAAVVEPRSGRTVSKISLRTDFDPAMAALLEGDVALRAGENDPATRIEDALFTLSDQIHFLHSLGDHQWVYVATERSDIAPELLLRAPVARDSIDVSLP